jgi:hypothetical protein
MKAAQFKARTFLEWRPFSNTITDMIQYETSYLTHLKTALGPALLPKRKTFPFRKDLAELEVRRV